MEIHKLEVENFNVLSTVSLYRRTNLESVSHLSHRSLALVEDEKELVLTLLTQSIHLPNATDG